MRHRATIAIALGLLLVGSLVFLAERRGHDPRDVRYWVGAGGDKDWSSEAALNLPEGEFFHGVSFIRGNLVTMADRVPWLSSVPVIGKRFFETIRYEIDGGIDPGRLAEGYRWIRKSADHGFAPAKEAEKLFIGRISPPKESH